LISLSFTINSEAVDLFDSCIENNVIAKIGQHIKPQMVESPSLPNKPNFIRVEIANKILTGIIANATKIAPS